MSEYEESSDNTVECCVQLLEEESRQLAIPFRQHATSFVVEAVSLMAASGSSPSFIIDVIAKLHQQGALSDEELQSRFDVLPSVVPFDVLHACQQLGIVSFIRYLQSCVDQPKKTTALVKSLVELACETPSSEGRQAMLRSFMDQIVEIGHGSLHPDIQQNIEKNTSKAATLILFAITRKVWTLLWQDAERRVDLYEFRADMNLSSYHKCCIEQLFYLMSYKPETKATAAIECQHEWTYLKIPSNVVDFIIQVRNGCRCKIELNE